MTTFSNFTVTQSNASGLGSISPDPKSTTPETDEFFINSVFEGSSFSVDLTIQGEFFPLLPEDPLEVQTPIEILTPVYESGGSLQHTILSANSIRIFGQYSLPGAYYRFKMYDGSQLVLPPDTTENFQALVQYKMPTTTTRLFTISIPVKFSSTETQTLVMSQWAAWRFSSASDTISSLVASRL